MKRRLYTILLIAVMVVSSSIFAYAETVTNVGSNTVYAKGRFSLTTDVLGSKDVYVVNAAWKTKPSYSDAINKKQTVNLESEWNKSGAGMPIDVNIKDSDVSTTTVNGTNLYGFDSTTYAYLKVPIVIECPEGYYFISYTSNSTSGGAASVYSAINATSRTSLNSIDGKTLTGKTKTVYMVVNIHTIGLRTLNQKRYYNPNFTFKFAPHYLNINFYANGGTKDGDTELTQDLLRTIGYKYDSEGMIQYGLPNANGGTWKLTKPGYRATNYWHIGSPDGPLLDADEPWQYVQDLAEYLDKPIGFKDQTVDLYADYELDEHYIDVNGLLDGREDGEIDEYGTFDVYINGFRRANDVNDFYQLYQCGSDYEIKDIRATNGHRYDGPVEGSIKGTVWEGDANIRLAFATKRPGTITITKKWNDDLEGSNANNRKAPKIKIQGRNPTRLQ